MVVGSQAVVFFCYNRTVTLLFQWWCGGVGALRWCSCGGALCVFRWWCPLVVLSTRAASGNHVSSGLLVLLASSTTCCPCLLRPGADAPTASPCPKVKLLFWWWCGGAGALRRCSGGGALRWYSGGGVLWWCCSPELLPATTGTPAAAGAAGSLVRPAALAFFDLDISYITTSPLGSPSGGSSSRRQHFVKVSCKEVVIGTLHGPSSCDSADMVYRQLARAVRLASGPLCLDPAAYAVLLHLL
nr:uncharacterized protein LOC127329506 [Lolium perenne]